MKKKTQFHTLAVNLAVAFALTSTAFASEQSVTETTPTSTAFATRPQEQYQTLNGIPAEALSHEEMVEVEGKFTRYMLTIDGIPGESTDSRHTSSIYCRLVNGKLVCS
jgi:hypothetical protein